MSCARRTVSVSSRTRRLMPPSCVGSAVLEAEAVDFAKALPYNEAIEAGVKRLPPVGAEYPKTLLGRPLGLLFKTIDSVLGELSGANVR